MKYFKLANRISASRMSRAKFRLPRRNGYKNLSGLEMAREIRFLHKSTRMNQHELAALFRINQGQVNKILHNKLFPEPHFLN